MSTHPIRIVTVTREFGAGGGEFARELGSRLGWPVLDQDIVHRVAARLRMEAATVEPFDEHPPSLLARIAGTLVLPTTEVYDFPPPEGVPTHDEVANAATHVIREAGERPPLVVVGHGAQCIFAGRPDALHVFLHSPLAARTRRIAERFHLDPAAAPDIVRRADQARGAYVQRYFHADWRADPLYDMRIGISRVSLVEAIAMVERLVRERGSVPDPVAAAREGARGG